jgi:hypothetical protein
LVVLETGTSRSDTSLGYYCTLYTADLQCTVGAFLVAFSV